MSALAERDPEIYWAITKEEHRLKDKIHLIASENAVSQAVLEATGSILTQKYAEGLPGKRYYQGCEWIDTVETLAINRAKDLFGAEHANVQPHAGSQANMAVYFAALKPGDRVLAMNLREGGHLTHGSPVNFSGQLYSFASYGVDPVSEMLNLEAIAQQAREFRPKLIVAGATAYPRVIDFARFRAIADEVGSLLMVDMAHIAGLIAAGVHPSPVPYADFVSSSTHKTLRGPRGGFVLCTRQHAAALDKAVFPGIQGGPLEHIIAGKAVAFREAQTSDFRDYQRMVVTNARALAGSLRDEGLRLVSNGTDNHLMLVDLGADGPSGAAVAKALDVCGIVANKNSVPRDKRPPTQTSGLRLGTPAATTAGFEPDDMVELGKLIARVIRELGNESTYEDVRSRVADLCRKAREQAVRRDLVGVR